MRSFELSSYQQTLIQRFKQYAAHIEGQDDMRVEGQLTRVVGLTLEAMGVIAPLGSYCLVKTSDDATIETEVVGFSNDIMYLMPITQIQGLISGAHVMATYQVASVPVSEQLLGRILDGECKPLDGGPAIVSKRQYPLVIAPINPLVRQPISDYLDVGIQAMNSLMTIGRGQRIGLFAGSGLGKSVLLSMMARYTEADVVVVGLIGERGREVKEFIEQNLGKEGLAKSVVIATPADNTPLMRLHGALVATSIAEYFRDQGKNVLLLMDSLTRFAQAQREIALAVGEPPSTKGYTPSVFFKLAQLVERAGNSTNNHGSITAFYTVLAEGDDQQDPIVDAARAILDGHIVLSRRLMEESHFPAIDIESSLSRVMPQITSPTHQQAAAAFRLLYSTYQQNRDLIAIGAYEKGSDKKIDQSIEFIDELNHFLKQSTHEYTPIEKSLETLIQLVKQFDSDETLQASSTTT